MIHSAINIISEVILIIRPENRTTYMVGWYFNYMCNASYAILCGWATTFLAHEPEVRTVSPPREAFNVQKADNQMIFASGTILSYLANAFLPLWTYPAKEAPNWKVGAKFYLGSMCVCAVGFVVTAWGLRKNERKRLRAAGQNVPKPHPLAFLWT